MYGKFLEKQVAGPFNYVAIQKLFQLITLRKTTNQIKITNDNRKCFEIVLCKHPKGPKMYLFVAAKYMKTSKLFVFVSLFTYTDKGKKC